MPGKPKILFILHLPPPVHGAAVVGEQIRSSRAVAEAFECRFVNLSTSSTLGDIGKVSLSKGKALLTLWKTVRRELEEFRPDWVYVTANSAGGGFLKDEPLVGMIKKEGFPVVVHFHNKGVATSHIPAWLYRRFFQDIRVILLSERLYPDIQAYVPPEFVRYCANGTVDPGPSLRRITSVPHILFLSNLIESKGILVLLDACKKLKDKGLRFVLDVAGGASAAISSARLQEEITRRSLEDIVLYHGTASDSDKEALFRNADIFTLPTYNDIFGLVIIEAMARSLPVVSTPEGAIPDIVLDGESGLIVPQKDVAALANALEKLLLNPALRQKMGARGREHFLAHYTTGQFERNFVQVMQSLLQHA